MYTLLRVVAHLRLVPRLHGFGQEDRRRGDALEALSHAELVRRHLRLVAGVGGGEGGD